MTKEVKRRDMAAILSNRLFWKMVSKNRRTDEVGDEVFIIYNTMIQQVNSLPIIFFYLGNWSMCHLDIFSGLFIGAKNVV